VKKWKQKRGEKVKKCAPLIVEKEKVGDFWIKTVQFSFADYFEKYYYFLQVKVRVCRVWELHAIVCYLFHCWYKSINSNSTYSVLLTRVKVKLSKLSVVKASKQATYIHPHHNWLDLNWLDNPEKGKFYYRSCKKKRKKSDK